MCALAGSQIDALPGLNLSVQNHLADMDGSLRDDRLILGQIYVDFAPRANHSSPAAFKSALMSTSRPASITASSTTPWTSMLPSDFTRKSRFDVAADDDVARKIQISL